MGSTINSWMATYAPNREPVTPEDAAAGLVKVLNEATVEDSGSFLNHDGSKNPW